MEGDPPCKFIVTDIEVFQGGEIEEGIWEGAREEVAAEVELEEKEEAGEAFGDSGPEAVGVEVEEGEVSQEAKFFWEGTGDVAVVEVDASDNGEVRVVGRRCTEDTGVAADVGAYPVRGEVLWVGCDLVFPCLESYKGLLEAGI